VNHKCVPIDAENSTHGKARRLFLDSAVAAGCTVLAPSGGTDPASEAVAYEARLTTSPKLARSATSGVPVFDLVLLGVGSDGHVGSLYPGRPEPLDVSSALVLPVQKGSGPGSITLSLAVMNAARRVLLSATGAGKAEAVRTCLEDKHAAGAFPAAMVACGAGNSWVVDEAAAARLAGAKGVAEMR